MWMSNVALSDCQEAQCYLQDDVERSLRTSLVSVLAAALAGGQANSEYLSGVLALARSQAALYGIPWCDVMASLRETPELLNLVLLLQDGCQGF
jgi:hypothetical protein